MTPPREGYVAWRRIGAGAGVGLFILLGIGGLVGVVLLTERSVGSPVSGDTQVEPLVVPVRTEDPAPVAVVGVTLLTSEGASVRVWRSGVLTSLEVAVGVRVEAGDVVATVDDRPIVAMTADAPLHRDLRRGDAGPDVRRLQAFLGQLGLLAGEPDGQFGPQT